VERNNVLEISVRKCEYFLDLSLKAMFILVSAGEVNSKILTVFSDLSIITITGFKFVTTIDAGKVTPAGVFDPSKSM
jgi:hypothetical protein